MKRIVILISLACFSHGAFADDQATPSPTPAYLPLARPVSVRRAEQIDRRRALEAEAASNAQTRAQAKANRRSTAAAQAQAKAAERAREQAQRQVAAEQRKESANATPHPTSDLMKRMGFSAEEIAAQKAREQSPQAGAPETVDATSPAEHHQQAARPAADPGTAGDHPALSRPKVSAAVAPKSPGASPAPGPDSP